MVETCTITSPNMGCSMKMRCEGGGGRGGRGMEDEGGVGEVWRMRGQ